MIKTMGSYVERRRSINAIRESQPYIDLNENKKVP